MTDYNRNFNQFVSSQVWQQYMSNLPKTDYKYNNKREKSETLYSLYEKIKHENSEYIEKLGGYLERGLAYDAVWAMAFALNKTLHMLVIMFE